MIKVSDINVAFKDQIVFEHAKITIPNGKLTAISGRSGAGKTTLFYILGLISSFKGYTYEFNGQDIDLSNDELKASLRKNHIGFVFQDKNLHEYFTIEENLKLYCLVSGQEYHHEKAVQILNQVHLALPLDTITEVLSGGEKQRLAIACALMKDPDLIIADEPTSALDNKNTDVIIELLKEIAAKGKMVIIATHNKRILNFCDYVCEIKEHKISEIEMKEEKADTSIVLRKIPKVFYRWYMHFQFGKGKYARLFLMMIPILAISISLIAFSIKDGLVENYKQSLNTFASNEVFVEHRSHEISERAISMLKSIEGVENVYTVPSLAAFDFKIDGKETAFSDIVQIVPYYPHQISYFDLANEKKEGDVYVSNLFAKQLKLKTGETIDFENLPLSKTKFTVKGIFDLDYSLLQSKGSPYVVYLPYDCFVETKSNQVILALESFEYLYTISEGVLKVNPTFNVVLSQDKFISQMSNLKTYTETLNKFVVVLSLMVIVILSVSQFFSIHNQKYELSVLKANGLSNKEINKMLLYQFVETILKTFIVVLVILAVSKGIASMMGVNMVLLSLKNGLFMLVFIVIDYFVPTVLSAMYINHFEPENILRF